MLCRACQSVWTLRFSFFFFFNDTATTEIYTLSLHDALPIYESWCCFHFVYRAVKGSCHCQTTTAQTRVRDRKSTRLNSSHGYISYAVFCLKKKKNAPRRLQP